MREHTSYEDALAYELGALRPMMARAGCRFERDGALVSLVSPRTGRHTLHMAPGVRPVSDLRAHVEGFVENQPRPRSPYTVAAAVTPAERAVRKAGRGRLLRDFARAARLTADYQSRPEWLLFLARHEPSRTRYACLMTAFGM